jgi:hypothetical protein
MKTINRLWPDCELDGKLGPDSPVRVYVIIAPGAEMFPY